MRFFAPFVALVAAVASAQQQYNAISIPQGGLQISAGSNTITWTNPSSGTVTIRLQTYPGVSTPGSGIVVASAVPASALTATVTIPAGSVVAGQQYVFEIVDNTGAVASNFSNNFSVSGATGTAVSSTATVTVTSSTSSSGTATQTSSTITNTNSSSSTRSSSSTVSRTSTSASESTSPTSAPSTGKAAGKMSGVQGSLLAVIAGAIALL